MKMHIKAQFSVHVFPCRVVYRHDIKMNVGQHNLPKPTFESDKCIQQKNKKKEELKNKTHIPQI